MGVFERAFGGKKRKKNPLIGGSKLLTTTRLKRHGFPSQKKRLQAWEKEEKKQLKEKERYRKGTKKMVKKQLKKAWRKLI